MPITIGLTVAAAVGVGELFGEEKLTQHKFSRRLPSSLSGDELSNAGVKQLIEIAAAT